MLSLVVELQKQFLSQIVLQEEQQDRAKEEYDVGRSLFYQVIGRLEKTDMVFKHVDGVWMPMTARKS